MEATKLELWCEEQWRKHGVDFRILRRELAWSSYEVTTERGKAEYTVHVMPVGGSVQFRKNFLLEWGFEDDA